MTNWDKAELQKLIDEGETLEEIGKVKGVSKQRVSQKVKELGIVRIGGVVKDAGAVVSQIVNEEFILPSSDTIGVTTASVKTGEYVAMDISNAANSVCQLCGGRGFIEIQYGLVQKACKCKMSKI